METTPKVMHIDIAEIDEQELVDCFLYTEPANTGKSVEVKMSNLNAGWKSDSFPVEMAEAKTGEDCHTEWTTVKMQGYLKIDQRRHVLLVCHRISNKKAVKVFRLGHALDFIRANLIRDRW